MPQTLPAQARASDAVAHARRYAGELGAAQLPRLIVQLADQRVRVMAEWHGERGRGGTHWLAGSIHGTLVLRCASCENAFEWALALEPRLRLVYSEADEARLLKEEEPFLVEDDALPLREITEDEILLALPLLPRCAMCDNARPVQPGNAPAVETGRSKPLAALKNLKI